MDAQLVHKVFYNHSLPLLKKILTHHGPIRTIRTMVATDSLVVIKNLNFLIRIDSKHTHFAWSIEITTYQQLIKFLARYTPSILTCKEY